MKPVEIVFKNWLDRKGYPYIFVEQSRNTFSAFFRGEVKRPDFLIAMPHFGIIAVDTKGRSRENEPKYTNFGLPLEELNKALNFSRIFRIPYWFVFGQEVNNFGVWYWILAEKIATLPHNEQFCEISITECIIMQANIDGLERLFIQV